MYGDDYMPEDPEGYKHLEVIFNDAKTRNDLRHILVWLLLETKTPRQDLHVLHKRTCIKKGWE